MQENLNEAEVLEQEVRRKRALMMRALEITCYVCGAGAFGVFARWLQVMTAFNEKGLVDKSVFNLLVPILVIGAAILFDRFTKQLSKERLYVSKSFCEALFNPGRIFLIIRWVACAIMCLGALVLVLETETDKNVDLLRAMAVFAFLSGISYPLYMGEANYEDMERVGLLRAYAVMPVLLYALWLVVSYKENIYNSVIWDYVLEMVTFIVCSLAFFRMAGFPFYAANGRKTMFYCMLGTSLCIMSLADGRYIGEQMILLSTGIMLCNDNWILIMNMNKKKPRPKPAAPQDGFQRL